MHFITAMKHKNKIRIVNHLNREFWVVIGILLYITTLFLGLVVALNETFLSDIV